MATTLFTSSHISSSFLHKRTPNYPPSFPSKTPFPQNSHSSVSPKPLLKRLHFYLKAVKDEENGASSSAVISKEEEEETDTKKQDLSSVQGEVSDQEQQEVDWKLDEEFKKFMGNPSIEAAIKLEKKRTDRKLKELDTENSDNPILGLVNKIVRDNLSREKERLEKAEEAFKALDLNKVIAQLCVCVF